MELFYLLVALMGVADIGFALLEHRQAHRGRAHALEEGLASARRGDIRHLGDFTKYVDNGDE